MGFKPGLLPLLLILLCLVEYGSPYSCNRSLETLICNNDLPDPSDIPEGVTSVVIKEYKRLYFTYSRHSFKLQTCQTIRKLQIECNNGLIHLLDNDFSSFPNLEELIIHSRKLHAIQAQAFAGLHKLNVLDMSNCIGLNAKQIIDSLMYSNTTFQLDVLNLNYMGQKDNNIFPFNYNFSFVLNMRAIKRLSIRGTNVLLTDLSQYDLPFVLQKIDLSDCNIYSIKKLKGNVPPLYSFFSKGLKYLRFLNMSGVKIDNRVPPNRKSELCEMNPAIYQVLETLDISRRYRKHWKLTTILDLHCFSNLKRIYSSSNNLYIFNATVYWPPRMEYIDISSNEMEMLSTRTLQGLVFLKHLDLSSNFLFRIENSSEFPYLFSSLKGLEYLNLGNNSFTSLPVTLFDKNTKLRILILRNNQLKSVSFIPVTFTQISLLDFQSNMISFLSDSDLFILNTLMDKLYTTTFTNLKINLLGNTFQCNCENLGFLNWIASTLQATIDPKYTCFFYRTIVNINAESLKKTEHNCYKSAIILSCTTVVVAISFVSGLTVYLFCNKRRKQHKYDVVKRFLEKMLKQRENYLVFISYSSEDTDLVMDVLEPAIKGNLKDKYDIPDSFVITGDSRFRYGYPVLSEIMRCIQLSCVMVCLISKSFCESDWCETELREAVQQHKPTILIFKEDIKKENMSDFVRMLFNRNARAKLELKDNVYVPIGGWDHFCECVVNLASGCYKHNEKRGSKRQRVDKIIKIPEHWRLDTSDVKDDEEETALV